MNREIKFRVWDNSSGYWVREDDLMEFSKPRYFNSYFTNVFDRDLVWQLFTGLKDRNGKEIYEGDIVIKRIKDNTSSLLPVKWNQQHCGFSITEGNRHEYQVVGNIFENPDLLV